MHDLSVVIFLEEKGVKMIRPFAVSSGLKYKKR